MERTFRPMQATSRKMIEEIVKALGHWLI